MLTQEEIDRIAPTPHRGRKELNWQVRQWVDIIAWWLIASGFFYLVYHLLAWWANK